MASIKERKGKDGKIHHHVQIRIKGHPPQHRSFTSKTKMREWIQHTESAIKDGRNFKTNESRKHTVGKMIDRYIETVLPTKKKSEEKQTSQLRWWKKQIGYLLLSDVTPAIIAEQRDILLKGNTIRGRLRSPSTCVRYLAALSHAFTVCIKEWGWLETSPIRMVTKPKEPRGRVRFLEQDERDRLVKICRESTNPHLYPIVVLALSTGMRQGEILTLSWSDIDLDKGKAILRETKNNEIRSVPITGLALELLKELDKVRRIDSQLVFPGKNPNQSVDIRVSWEKAVAEAGLVNFRFHDLRHDAASSLLASGASLAAIAEILGHKTLAMVKRYAHLSESCTKEIVTKMNERIFA